MPPAGDLDQGVAAADISNPATMTALQSAAAWRSLAAF
jgi:hypothetical protein